MEGDFCPKSYDICTLSCACCGPAFSGLPQLSVVVAHLLANAALPAMAATSRLVEVVTVVEVTAAVRICRPQPS